MVNLYEMFPYKEISNITIRDFVWLLDMTIFCRQLSLRGSTISMIFFVESLTFVSRLYYLDFKTPSDLRQYLISFEILLLMLIACLKYVKSLIYFSTFPLMVIRMLLEYWNISSVTFSLILLTSKAILVANSRLELNFVNNN